MAQVLVPMKFEPSPLSKELTPPRLPRRLFAVGPLDDNMWAANDQKCFTFQICGLWVLILLDSGRPNRN
jgi:hypothetical protein